MVAVAERGERVTGQWTSDLRPADSTRCHNCTGVPWNGIGCGGVLLPQSLWPLAERHVLVSLARTGLAPRLAVGGSTRGGFSFVAPVFGARGRQTRRYTSNMLERLCIFFFLSQENEPIGNLRPTIRRLNHTQPAMNQTVFIWVSGNGEFLQVFFVRQVWFTCASDAREENHACLENTLQSVTYNTVGNWNEKKKKLIAFRIMYSACWVRWIGTRRHRGLASLSLLVWRRSHHASFSCRHIRRCPTWRHYRPRCCSYRRAVRAATPAAACAGPTHLLCSVTHPCMGSQIVRAPCACSWDRLSYAFFISK